MARSKKQYDEFRDSQAEISRERSEAGREIGPIPPVGNPSRRERGESCLLDFLMEYFPSKFPLEFSDDHLRLIQTLQEVCTDGGRVAIAFSRAAGKTTIALTAALWATMTGRRRFVAVLAATEPHAEKIIKAIRAELETNDRLLEDFPEVCYPIRKLDRIALRAIGQTCNDQPTRMLWTSDAVQFASIPGSRAAGAAIVGKGLTAAVRGMSLTGPDGEMIRPDLALIDDPMTKESARSVTQSQERYELIQQDVLGLAGPTTEMTALCLVTPQYENDTAEMLLDSEKSPGWRTYRCGILKTLPKNLQAWEKYGEIRRECLQDGDIDRLTAYYIKNRETLEAGAVASWQERKKPSEVSAIQSAMHIWLDNRRAFQTEYMCQPLSRAELGEYQLDPGEVQRRTNGMPRYVVPSTATKLVASIDVGGRLLWWSVAALNERMGGAVVDYGSYPQQSVGTFSAKSEHIRDLSSVYTGFNEEQCVYQGLKDLLDQLFARKYIGENGNEYPLDRVVVDTGWCTQPVLDAIRASDHQTSIFGSRGAGRSLKTAGVAKWKVRPGEKAGNHWLLSIPEKRIRVATFDTDYYKSLAYERLVMPLGPLSAVSLYGTKPTAHTLYAQHLAAEVGSWVEIRGERFIKWAVTDPGVDNHWLDTFVGCFLAGSLEGLAPNEPEQPSGPTVTRRKKSMAERQREKMDAR